MSNPCLVPFRAEHLLKLVSRNPFDNEMIDDGLQKERGGPAFTALLDDKPLASAGVTLVRRGVGAAWTVFGHDFVNHKLWITRTLRAAFRDIINGCNLHRIEAQVLESQLENQKWIEVLGFESEGIAHDYTSDRRNVVRYEWLRYKIRVRTLDYNEVDMFDSLVRTCGFSLDTAEWFAPDNRILVATENERLIGYAVHSYATFDYGYTAYGRNMAIHPEYRNRGLGEILHRARLRDATNAGAVCFVGHIKGNNPALERIFRKYGAQHPVESPLGTLYICKLEKGKW